MLSLKNLGQCWKTIPSRNLTKIIQRKSNPSCTRTLTIFNQNSNSTHLVQNINQNNLKSIRFFQVSATLRADIKTISVPPFADSVSEGDIRWIKAVGDAVTEDETVGEVETDKTAVPINAPCSGIITEILVEDGSTVTPGTAIFKLESKDIGVKTTTTDEPKPVPDVAAPQAASNVAPQAASNVAAPAASGTIPSVPPPAPVLPKAPLQSIPVAAIKHSSFISSAEVKIPPSDYSKEITGTRTEQRVKTSRMRLRIAQRLKEAQTTNVMLTTFNEIDVGNLMELRKSVGEAFLKKHGFKLGFMSAFMKASANALQQLPVVNAVMDNQEIVYRDYVDISVAVATPKGLVVPVVRNVEGMNFADIERSIIALGVKAKSGNLAVEDMDGGTFTISNGGVFGSMFGTPIINPPQSSILGMHGIFERPVGRKGQVVLRPMMYVALTYDHRLIDGREAVTFLRKIKEGVEDPRIMLCGL